MRKLLPGHSLLVLLGALFVSSCALPVPIQVASWALDGISYMATQKSVTDHGISFVTQKDCALWRTVQGKGICDDYDDAGTVAVAALGPVSGSAEPVMAAQEIEAIEKSTESVEIIAIETASGDEQVPVASVKGQPVLSGSGIAEADPIPVAVTKLPVPEVLPVVAAVAVAAEPASVKTNPELVVVAVEQGPAEPVLVADLASEMIENPAAVIPAPTGERILIPGQRTWSDKSDANIYYVIGSFQNRENAKRLVERHMDLGPSVMATRINGVETYRVAVGPFTHVEQRSVGWTIQKTGIRESWAISIDPSQWMIARPTVPVKAPVASNTPASDETALVPMNLNQNASNSQLSVDNKEKVSKIYSGKDPSVGVGSEAGKNTSPVVARTEPGTHEAGGERLPVNLSDQIGRVVDLA